MIGRRGCAAARSPAPARAARAPSAGPTNSASRFGRRLASTSRSSASASRRPPHRRPGIGSGAVTGDGRSLIAPARAAGCCGAAADGRSGSPTSASCGDDVDRVGGLLAGEAEPGQRVPQLIAPRRDRGRPRRRPGVGPRRRRSAPIRSRSSSDDPLGALAADARHLDQRGEVAGRDRPAHLARRVHAPGSSGPASGRRRWRSAAARTAPARRRRRSRRGSASPRGRPGWWPAGPSRPTRSRASVPGEQDTARPTPPTSTTAPSGPSAATRRRTLAIIAGPGPASAGRIDPGLRRPAPHLADRERQRVGGVGRPRRLGQPEQPGDHRADLGLVGAPGAGDRGLHLARRVQRDRDAGPGGGHDREPGHLGGAHDGADVVLAEHPLDGDDVRAGARRSTRRSASAIDEQPPPDVGVGRRADDVDVRPA